MTWSIVAHDPQTGAFAVAVTTAAFAVGASCPFLRSRVGAVSTHSLTNRYLGPPILNRLDQGLAPAAAIEDALATDAGRHVRQVHAVDRHGRGSRPDLDIRIDDHPEPLADLRRLLGIWRAQALARSMWAPTKANPSGVTDLDAIETAWREKGLDIRFPR